MRHQKPATHIVSLKRGSAARNKAERDANRSGARCYLAPAGEEPVAIDGVGGETEIKAPVDVPAWVGWRALEAKKPVIELTLDQYEAATAAPKDVSEAPAE